MRVGKTLSAYMVALCALSVLPLVTVIWVSFTGELYLRFPPRLYSFHWYRVALSDSDYRHAFFYSCLIAGIGAVIAVFIGSCAAYAFIRHRSRLSKAVESLAFLPIILPAFVLGVSFLVIFIDVGVPLAPVGLISAQCLLVIPFVIRFVMSTLANMPSNVESASRSLGASRLYSFRRVMLPLLAPGLIAGLLVAFLRAFDETDAALFLTGPGHTTLPVYLFQQLQDTATPVPVVVGAITIVLTAIIVLVLDRTVGLLKLILQERT